MFRKSFRLALTFGALATGLIAAAPAIADGWWGRGSIKDRRAAVPVPAPAPIPDYAARWYLRGDLGVGFSKPDPSENGIVYGQNLHDQWDATSNLQSRWLPNDTETTFSYGAGIGYYWAPHFRTDITLERISERKLKMRGTYSYDAESGGNDYQVHGETHDKGELNSGLFLFNAYFDFVRNGPLTPYIGAGVGFAVNKLERTFFNEEDAEGTTIDDSPIKRSDSTHNVTFAAALMAGVSYSITPVTMLDLNYRYLYMSGSDIDLNINGVKSNFSTGDIHEHQVRLGLRWNI